MLISPIGNVGVGGHLMVSDYDKTGGLSVISFMHNMACN